jgi:hypothetical protein
MAMDKIKFVSGLAIVLLVINLVLVGFIFFRGQGNFRPPRPDQIITERLQLTPSQQEQFRELRDEHHSAVVVYRDSIRLLKKELINGLKSDDPDQVQMQNMVARISKLEQQVEVVTINHFTSLRKLCSDKQKIVYDEFIQEIAMALDRPGPPGGRP